MKVLIVGGKSSVAHALAPLLAQADEVITVGRQGCDIHLDLSESTSAFCFPKMIDVVVHTAASYGGPTPEAMVQAAAINALGTLKVCQASLQAGARYVLLLSTIYAPLAEGDRHYSIYSLSKRHAEELALFFCRSAGLPLGILRPAPLYGEAESFRRHQPLLYTMAEQAKRGEDLRLYGTRDALRNYLHVDDLARVIVLCLRKRLEGVYSCCHPENVHLSTIAAALVSAFGSTSRVLFDPQQQNQPDNIFPADNRLYDAIGYAPEVSIQAGMGRIATWLGGAA